MSEKYKIDIILRSSPQKQYIDPQQKFRKYPIRKDSNSNDIFYSRHQSVPVPPRQTNIDLRSKIINPKQCFIRASSVKQKQCQIFTQKCLDILSKKKKSMAQHQHRSKMHNMMDNIVEKCRKNAVTQKTQILKSSAIDVSSVYPNTTAYNKFSAYQDKIEVYRMLKTTQTNRDYGQKGSPKKQQQWKKKPDVTGIRMNKILKSQPYDIQGVTCFSLPISDQPTLLAKRHSVLSANVALQSQQRSLSQSSSRRRIKINRTNSNKFMAFSRSADPDALYMKKLKSFLDFIFKVNFSNKIYISIELSNDTSNPKKYKAYIGRGNNSLLIRSLLKRRFWMQIVDNIQQEGINFYWTQNKIDRVHYRQKVSKGYKKIVGQEQLDTKSKIPKTPEQRQMVELNKKILQGQQASQVQKYILKNGYVIPFQTTYQCEVVSNHIPRNSCIGSKKNLFKSLLYYYRDHLKIDPFTYIPKTYSIKNPQDPQFKRFLKDYEKQPNKIWIVKPGQNSNRGIGIKLAESRRVIDLVKKRQKHANGHIKTYILQSYIEKPFLYNNRKFDIRHYMMLTSVNGILKAFWYKQGYLRTSSQKYDLDDLDNQVVHLTNDAIQKKYEDYQKYQPGNKLSYSQFQRYLDSTHPAKNYNFQKDIIPAMRSIILDVIKANYNSIDKSRRQCNFQIFGFDFMLDKQFKPWLIEINFNPCLEMSCPLLSRIIPVMVQSSLRIGVDPLLPPFNHYAVNKRFTLSDNYLKNQRYEIMFDQSNFNQTIPEMHIIQDSDDEQEEYCDDGKQIEQLVI